ncbi:MAG: LamG-like jellyroll fold domain-containing protein [Methylophilaceae bacterium]
MKKTYLKSGGISLTRFLLFFSLNLFITVAYAAPLDFLNKTLVSETSFDNTATAFVNDYSSSGSPLDDSIDRNVPLGFSFPFGGTNYTTVNIVSNGFLRFTTSNNTYYGNTTLDGIDATMPHAIFPYWNDLNPGGGGNITYSTLGTAPNRRFVTTWTNVPHYNVVGSYSFQVVLYEDSVIRFRYDSTSDANGSSNGGATIGVIENDTKFDQHSYNTTIDASKDIFYSPLPPPPVDYGYSDWRFDEDGWNGTANEVKDSHAGFHGTAYNAPTVPGKICNAMDLRANGTQDYASLGAASLNGVNDFTISVWHKGASANGRSLLSGAGSSGSNELIFWHASSTNFGGHLKGNNLGGVTTSNIANNTWRHLVWRRTGGQSCYFIDAQLQNCQPTSQSAGLNISSLILGQEQDSIGGGFDGGQDWEGILDELLIFRRALDNTAINGIYTNQNAGKNWDGSYRACPNMPNMKLTKTSQVISDPVNLTNNPKRIPGATVRYTIRAENIHSTAGENVTITDSLNTFIGNGKIEWFGNIVLNSPNTNGGAATLLSDAIDGDVGQFNANTLTVECGNISNTGPCIVRYDIKVK